MKRTPFHRKVYERPLRPPLTRVENCRGTYALSSNEPVVVEKDKPVRCEAYRRYAAEQECFLCGVYGWSQAAHENVGKGLQTKTCDSRIFPACGPRYGLMGCHQQFDIGLEYTREERRDLGARLSARLRERATAAGWVFDKEGIRKV